MGLQGLAFLPSRVSFSTTYLKNCGSGESIGTIGCLWLGVGKGMLHVKYFRSNKASFVSIKFPGDLKTVTRLR